MATCASDSASEEPILKGFLTKQGGGYKTWEKRYFVLRGTTLTYYAEEGDTESKGVVDLTTGRGVRTKTHCKLEEWPKEAKASLSFGVATESLTYYLHGTDKAEVNKWKEEIEKIIKKDGKPTEDWKNDPEGYPEPLGSKIARNFAKFSARIVKIFVKESGLVDDDVEKVVEGAADAVEDQADASRDASATDRLKMAAGDAAGIVGDTVDDPVAGAACNVVKEQAKADDDVTLGQRAGMLAGTGLKEASQFVPDETGAGAVKVAGEVVHGQATADTDASIQQRMAIGVGSAAAGVGDAVDDDKAKAAAKIVEKGAEKAKELIEKKEKENKDKSDDDGDDKDDK